MSTKKRAIQIEPTCVRRARSKKEKPLQDKPTEKAVFTFESGRTSCIGSGVYAIKRALEHFDPHDTASDLFIKAETGIDVTHSKNKDLLDNLFKTPSIDVQQQGERIIFKRNPHLGIQDCDTLKQAIDSAWSGNKMTIAMKDLSDTYREVERDVERLAEDRDVSSLHIDGSSIFFKRLQGTSASSCIKDMWHNVEVPKGHLLQDALVDRRILTRDEVDVREARMKSEREKEKMEADQAAAAKKPRKMPIIRKVTNTHLELPRPEGFD